MGDRAFGVETIELDLPVLAGAFSRRLRDAGVPSTPERASNFAHALRLVRPISRRRLYCTARAVFVSDPSHVKAFESVFATVFGTSPVGDDAPALDDPQTIPAPPDERPETDRRPHERRGAGHERSLAAAAATARRHGQDRQVDEELPVPVTPSNEELLRGKRFDALEPHELVALYRLMGQLEIAPPLRRTRRASRAHHGERIDLRRTLRGSFRTAGDPIRLARRRRRVVRRRMVLLCDISGSMEPYARAYLQFLTCAAGGGRRTEAFVFATGLTRLTRALASRNPDRAIQRAAAAAPDWSSGTRIGEALKAFNDRYGRRGMACGAVIVILSDGWERGDPALVGREMEHLARLAHRIVWVNPRVSAAAFSPRTGGMSAALPHCDALVSGDSLDALDEVIAAIGGRASADDRRWSPAGALGPEPEEEEWASATPVAGSSVAMPSGYGPSRGNTTPGWRADR
jgi:uncharacterized protein with von Willebrand factor type A (vWA) domain